MTAIGTDTAELRLAGLRASIEATPHQPGNGPVADFSADGGVTVSGAHDHFARLQPLGRRVRISLADPHGLVAEGEVDADALIDSIAVHGDAYTAASRSLRHENGPGDRHRRRA